MFATAQLSSVGHALTTTLCLLDYSCPILELSSTLYFLISPFLIFTFACSTLFIIFYELLEGLREEGGGGNEGGSEGRDCSNI